MLSDVSERAVRKAVQRMGKKNWRPLTLELDDLRQEAYVAVCEAQNAGIIDLVELQRIAETHVRRIIAREARYLAHESGYEDDETDS